MLSSLLQSLPRRRWKLLDFSNATFARIPEHHKIEEEKFPDYVASRYYPTRIGELIKERYQVVGKLGLGLHRLLPRRYVVLKICVQASFMAEKVDDELKMYRYIEWSPCGHPGRDAIRTLLDTFDIEGPHEKHRYLVHHPSWESVLTFLRRNPVERLPSMALAVVLYRMFLALDYLHTECHIVHTDIKTDNIMIGIKDDSVCVDLEEEQLQQPIPMEQVDADGRTIYISRELMVPKNKGLLVLCDFGSAMFGDQYHSEFVQPNVYRAPEVILEAPWTWGHLFAGYVPEFQKYRSRAHLAEIINLLGPPPASLLAQGKLRDKFCSDDGKFLTENLLTDQVPLEERETTL
ncbi:uncharacterized protein TRUGW13939_04153 [Talaromyces rugulosus]|uniref:non-specific serine/threonine protein kinase n=1 Tax=Talaromyces rugulosus TaxID=121627 RepID=A0A7H8QU95_TALRU|nr:uncharacterized protein TRUGW13939_04153 [Talaromyces rugulosus]QKX57045.1 hypothetical protein TRUGW13939_04153 [Talaromyces rugulosus]